MKFNPLIGFWHAVDLDEVKDGLNSIPCDKVQASYFPYPFPHRIIEKFFRDNTEYTHLIMIPNDLVYNNSNFERTKEIILKHDYPVLCGLCNVDLKEHKDQWNVCQKLPELPYTQRRYRWLANSTRKAYINLGLRLIPVKFAGYPATCIRRDVLDKIRLNIFPEDKKVNELPIWESKGGFSNDLMTCHNLNDVNISIMCDLENTMLHFRYTGKSQIGIKPEKVKFIHNGELIDFNVTSVTNSEISKLCQEIKRQTQV